VIVTGADLERFTDAELDVLIGDRSPLFARVLPEQKLRLVEALQRRGDVVAVTGDGVNDAPALRRADVGVAMGQTGTDVAREAADLVLADDNFASIVAAIEEGRAIYANVRKFMTYILASNVPEVVPFVLFVLFGIPLPLIVMQILAVDLGTDLLPALALGAERPEPDVMLRPPRPRSERLLDARTLARAYAWLGSIEAVLALAAYFFAYLWSGWSPGEELPGTGAVYRTATTMSFAGIVACQIGNVFACRSDHESVRASSLRSNPLLLLGVASEIALLLLLVYVPVVARPFGLEPLGLAHWAFLVPFPAIVIGLEETRKALTQRRVERTKARPSSAPHPLRASSQP
jgi:magnesium-transporting ATPase (P-type)